MHIRIKVIIAPLLLFTIQSCKTFDATNGAKEYCEVHDQKMKQTRTWIKYGLREMKNIETDYFQYPHPKTNYYGGCDIRKDRPKLYKNYYSSKCNKVKKKKKHQITSFQR